MQSQLNIHPILRLYNSLFAFVAKKQIEAGSIEPRKIHSVLVAILATSLLMWSHVILLTKTVDSDVVFWTGIICSVVHLSSISLFRFTNSTFSIINTMLACGMTYVTTTVYYTGGFQSFALIWAVATPMLGGMASGQRGAKLWGIISFTIIMTFFIMSITGYQFPDLLTPEGKVLTHYVQVFGWLILGSVLSFTFVALRETAEAKLHEQTEKVDSLFRVLFHDLANSLGRINIGHTIAKKEGQFVKGMKIAEGAADSMFEITQNVRKIYAVSKGKADMELTLSPLNESITYVTKIFADELDKKQIKLKWDMRKLEGLKLLVEPVSFKNQVLANILSNCIKFSPEGSEITISAYPNNHHYFTVEIKDSGIGMPPAILENLFDLNKKTSRPGTKGEFGTGFGMHIMKSFMEIYQGDVKVESNEREVDSGTTFKLSLKGEWP